VSKLFICKRSWKRHEKGAVINEWEWKKLAIESRESFFEPYNPEPTPVVEPAPAVVEFTESLKNELEHRGIKTETKFNKKNEVSFKFEAEDNI
jgi:hypothetical protein